MSAAGTPPRTDPAALAIACAMAFLAGATDVAGLIRLNGVFVSFMSGNSTLLGIAFGEADGGRAGTIAVVIALFVAGATLGAVLAVRAGPHHAPAVMAAVALVLLVPLASPAAAVAAFAIAMGLLNGAMTRAGRTGVSLTYVTGALVKFAHGLGARLCGRRADSGWQLQALLWIALIAGAVAAARIRPLLASDVPWPLPAMAAILAVASAFRPFPE
ncbi:MAG TPA: YoaK family protein [Acetobacteraceae bacterium]|nr:YoaK family protein [Acetobacteraceae bacterium]